MLALPRSRRGSHPRCVALNAAGDQVNLRAIRLVCHSTLTKTSWVSRTSVAGTTPNDEHEKKDDEEIAPLEGGGGAAYHMGRTPPRARVTDNACEVLE